MKRPACAGGKFGPPSPRRSEQASCLQLEPPEPGRRPGGPKFGERCLGGFNLEFANGNGFARRIVQPREASRYSMTLARDRDGSATS